MSKPIDKGSKAITDEVVPGPSLLAGGSDEIKFTERGGSRIPTAHEFSSTWRCVTSEQPIQVMFGRIVMCVSSVRWHNGPKAEKRVQHAAVSLGRCIRASLRRPGLDLGDEFPNRSVTCAQEVNAEVAKPNHEGVGQ